MSLHDANASGAPEPQSEADIAAFRTAMRHLAGAVSVITTGLGEQRTGFTATSVSSFSMEPPAMIVCVNRTSSSWPVLREHQGFCINVLAHDQLHVADRFAGRGGVKGAARYEGAQWQSLVTGALALSSALTVIDCQLEEAIERHSHAILIGRVRAIRTRERAEPLLYWHGAYRHISHLDRVLTSA
jgi:flavin reductase (DIM6/NTAB) family NADH-FMN oxidoreductase RutF